MDPTPTEIDLTAPRWAPFLPGRLQLSVRHALRRPLRLGATAVAAITLFGCAHGLAARTGETPLPNLALPTAGGQQLWADTAWHDGWRVQEHVWTGHARLLDDRDVRRAWGSLEACEKRLDERRRTHPVAENGRRTVVLLHGLWRTRHAMAPLAASLEEAGFEVIDVAYPSTRRSIDEHAAGVADLLDGLAGEGREVSFVTHSLGGLVLRALLARDAPPWRQRHGLGRAVLIAAPNQGSELARLGARIPGALGIYGVPSREIAAGVAAELPALPLPFMTVAAGGPGEGGWNPLISGDDDGVVSVEETHLAGEAASLRVEAVHTWVMADPEVVCATRQFLVGNGTPPTAAQHRSR